MSEWKYKLFKNCIQSQQSRFPTVPEKEYLATGKLPIIDQGAKLIAGYTNDITLAYSGAMPAIVFGDHTRIFKFIDYNFAIGADGTKVFSPNEEFDPKFFYYALLALSLPNDGYGRHYKHLKVSKIPWLPLPEQQAIASRLSRQMEEIERMRRVAERQLESANKLLISWIDNEVAELDQSSGKLADVLLEEPQNGWSPTCDNKHGGIPVLTLSAVTGFRYRGNQYKLTSEPTDENAHYWVKKDDLLITRSNTEELVGHATICDGTPNKAIYPDLIMRTRVNSEKANLEFVHLWLMSSCTRRYIMQEARGANPTMKKINKDIVNEIPFPSDSTVEEQTEILSSLKSVISNGRNIELYAEKQLEAINSLPSAYLREVFGIFEPPELDELPDIDDEAEELEEEDEQED